MATHTGYPHGPATTAAVRRALLDRGTPLPRPWQLPPGVVIPASLVRVVGTRVLVSGHVPIAENGTIAGPAGRVGENVDLETAQTAAVRCLLGVLAALDDTLGDLVRIRDWCRLAGMVRAAGTFDQVPAVFNPASQLLLDLFGEHGAHSRIAFGVDRLPFDQCVELEAELEIAR